MSLLLFYIAMFTIAGVGGYIAEKQRKGEAFFFHLRRYLRERKESIDKQNK